MPRAGGERASEWPAELAIPSTAWSSQGDFLADGGHFRSDGPPRGADNTLRSRSLNFSETSSKEKGASARPVIMLTVLMGALLAVPRRAPLQPDADRDASWQPFVDYLSTKGVETIYNCGFESVATACPEVASDAVPQSGYGDVSDLMVPAGEHVLLVGSSHMRSIAELIMAAHRFSNDEPQKSDTRDSNDCMLNQTAAELKAWRESANSTGHIGQCGLFDRLWHGQQLAGQVDCEQSDFFTATFPSGGSLTIVANFAGWQLGDDEPSLLDRVGQDIDARKITHAIYSPHHDKTWFYGRCGTPHRARTPE